MTSSGLFGLCLLTLLWHGLALDPVPAECWRGRCSAPVHTVDCRWLAPRFFCNATSFRCKHTDSSCGFSGTGFGSLERCEANCRQKVLCYRPMEPGTSPGRGPVEMLKFFYNISSEKCERFTFRGSGSNGNIFQTPEECEALCAGVKGPQRVQDPVSTKDQKPTGPPAGPGSSFTTGENQLLTQVTTSVTTAPVMTAPVTTTPVTTTRMTTSVTTAPVMTAPVTTTRMTTSVTTAPVTTTRMTTSVMTAPVTTARMTTSVTTAPVTTAVITAPVMPAPVMPAPLTTAPVTTTPVMNDPVTEMDAPVTDASVTDALVTETDAPETETDAPVTDASVTETDAPVKETDAPVTDASVTETDAPETETAASAPDVGMIVGLSLVLVLVLVLLLVAFRRSLKRLLCTGLEPVHRYSVLQPAG
ncbi:uncharacterized protein V6R79_003106 [Siganus canaliculatus]